MNTYHVVCFWPRTRQADLLPAPITNAQHELVLQEARMALDTCRSRMQDYGWRDAETFVGGRPGSGVAVLTRVLLQRSTGDRLELILEECHEGETR